MRPGDPIVILMGDPIRDAAADQPDAGAPRARRHVSAPQAAAHFDVVVVGGGPAGTAFVRRLRDVAPSARALLLDAATFPRDKVCGDALTYRSLPVVLEIFPELAGALPSESATLSQKLWYPGGAWVSRHDQVLDVIPRRRFDHLLWEAARAAGVETWERTRALRVRRAGGRVVGIDVERDGKRFAVACDLLVGADGSASVVRRDTGSLEGDRVIFAVRQYVRGIPAGTEGLHFVLDPGRKGYFWLFPFRQDGECWANIGYGNDRRGSDLRRILGEFVGRDDVKALLGTGELLGTPRGFPLNVADAGFPRRFRPSRTLAGDGYLLLGDAAALIHPFTGEGIAFALESGRIAAEVLADDGVAAVAKAAAYERRVIAYASPFYSSLGVFLAVGLPCLLPGPLGRLYTRTASAAHRVLYGSPPAGG